MTGSAAAEGEAVPEISEKAAAKAAKKAAERAAKEAKKADRERQLNEQRSAATAVLSKTVENVEVDTYGFLPSMTFAKRTDRTWTDIGEINESFAGKSVWIRARISELRAVGKTMVFLVLRHQLDTIQAVLSATSDEEKNAAKFTGILPVESIVDIYGEVTIPPSPILTTTQAVEICVRKCHCVARAQPELPFQLKDANRPEGEVFEDGTEAIVVSQDTRLDNRVLDLRTFSMQAVLRISSEVCTLFREYLRSQKFVEIHTPKTIGGSSEGGSNVFKFQYFNNNACLAQSPQLHKQMSVTADFDRVFEIGPVFRAENSNTHRHLCEFTGLDMEMAFKEHYFEVLDVIEGMFIFIFQGLNDRCAREIAAVYKQWPNTPFRWTYKKEGLPESAGPVLRLTFAQGCQLLREAKFDIPEDLSDFDINTEQEKSLGKLVREKYDTDFYYMTDYPLKVRPFYTMPNFDDNTKSNSYDFFMRGEEILSGAQRIHDPELLSERAAAWGIELSTLKAYIDSFKLGAQPHGGCGVGLERVVMLFLGLNNIRKVSMFPRDPKRLSP